MAAISRNFRVYHKLEPPFSLMLENKSIEDTLMFESNAVTILSSAETDTIKKQYSKILDAYGCLGVLNLNTGGDENILYLVLVTGCVSVGKIGDSEIFCITATHFVSLQNRPGDEDRIVGVRNVLNSRTFYFAWSSTGVPWDLTLCAQRKIQDHDTDSRFFWNRSMHVHLQRFGIDCDTWLFKTICGGVEIRTVYAAHRQARACLISRLSCERAGTRFNVRGTNDDGHVANFCETEQVIFLDGLIASYLQTRGSVPLFWEQPGIQVGSHKVKMSRGYEASAPAFERHLGTLKEQYGEQVVVNLLGRKEGEHLLSQAFMNHHKASRFAHDIPLISFDYHTECRGGNLKNLEKLRAILQKYYDKFEYFYSENGEKKRYQTGTVRTNCLDCLDRTNAVQCLLGLQILNRQLEDLGLAGKPQMVSRFTEIYKQIWILNGDHISMIYAGTGALGGGRSKTSDAARSATRTIQNNFLDNNKQEAMDILLLGSTLRGELADRARALLTTCRMNAPPAVLYNVVSRYREYVDTENFRVCAGTWNVNGGKHFRSIAFKHQSMNDWLLDAPKMTAKTKPEMLDPSVDYDVPVDIFAIGFEEMVDLNASNIVNTSQTNSREWEKYIQKTISRDHKYVLLTKVQLVGVLLYVFIRPQLAPYIRDVAVDIVKTGMGGAAGNKGGVGIRFLLHATSICFVCAHLAAGQSQINDRNNDYAEISKKMSFPMGRALPSHNYVFWCGDFNYRIDLPNEQVKDLIAAENWDALEAFDQLNIQRKEDKAFQGFSEGPTRFAPTYKYDLFCDDYDTSDKSRTPAWTDRVLWRHNPFLKFQKTDEEELKKWPKLLLYTRSELKTSDHRPVLGLFDVQVMKVRDTDRDRVYEEALYAQGPQDATVIVSMVTGEFDDDMVDEIVGTFSDAGEIILVRFVDEEMWLIYKTGAMALQALQYNNTQISDQEVGVRLKTGNWRELVEAEMRAASLRSEPLFNQFTNSLLGEDFDVPGMENYDSEGDEEEGDTESLPEPIQPARTGDGSPHSGSPSPADGMFETSKPKSKPAQSVPPLRPQPSSRSRPPPTRPRDSPPTGRERDMTLEQKQEATPQVARSAADMVIVPESAPMVRGNPSETIAKPSAASRTGPPVKPPPPQRPVGGPPRPSPPKPSSSPLSGRKPPGPAIKQPLGSQAIGKIKSKQQNKIVRIGLPTNVTHMGHANSPEEAAALIEKLMLPGGSDLKGTLPAPLKPGGLKASTNIPRSKTSEDVNSDTLPPPPCVTKAQSVENISSTSRPIPPLPQLDPGAGPPPQPAPRRESLPAEKETEGVARPRPAPRRNVQSCVFDPSSVNVPAVASRPMSVADRGNLPRLPQSYPETSQNYYSSVVDHTRINPDMGKVLLNGSSKHTESSAEQSAAMSTPGAGHQEGEYETLWGNTPAVPKRKDIVEEPNTLLDKPISPQAFTSSIDPFDTSAITQRLPPSVPLQPLAPAMAPPTLPSVPPRPGTQPTKHSTNIMSQLDEQVTNGDSRSYDAPPSSPPPSPPRFDCPAEPPPPPPSEDFPSLDELSATNSTSMNEVANKLMLLKEPTGPAPVLAPPPVPTRPPVSADLASTNQQPGLMEMPPIPARPAVPPPVPKRPTN
ncbi:synaptojanin-1-like [Mya arenaria]|uniref:synaptojanin-1-like n=1 Tax=Mya arenaria TaxID=6604 RepID=UPI0022E6018D|nr:synaptojanin-1-like [Mya arenaria]